MNPLRQRWRVLAAFAVLLCARCAAAQVLTTGDTIGKGKTGMLLTENGVFVDDVRLNIAYGELVRGLSSRFDLYIAGGATTTEGETQAWVGSGGNLHVLSFRRLSVSAYNVASVALTRRDEACDVLLNSALVASVSAGSRVFLYSGVNSLIPIGHRARGVFTPPDSKFNVPIGATVLFGRWGLWGEFDAGPLHALGVGVSAVF
jgi:hypothetical protein